MYSVNEEKFSFKQHRSLDAAVCEQGPICTAAPPMLYGKKGVSRRYYVMRGTVLYPSALVDWSSQSVVFDLLMYVRHRHWVAKIIPALRRTKMR